MRFKAWKNRSDLTLGAELEFRFGGIKNQKLKYCADKIKKDLPKNLKKYVHDEFSLSLLELVTPICNSADECVDFLKKSTKTISKIAKKHEANIIASGVYPDEHESIRILNQKRYRRIKDEFGVLLDDFTICGFHIHVGFSSSKRALKAYNLLINYSPIFICLLANSPFYKGKDTKILSYRLTLFDRLYRSGIPPYFKSYKKMQKEYEEYFNSNIISSQNDIWWDLRIKPEFGTLEIRISDSVSDFERLKVAILLYQSLCLYAQNAEFKPLCTQILKANRWSAIRHGFDGFMYEHKEEKFRDFTLNLISKMKKDKIFKKLNIENEIDLIIEYINKPSLAKMQLDLYKKTGDFKKILDFGVIR